MFSDSMSAVDGVVYVDGKIVFLEEEAYYSPSIINEETDEVRPLKPIPTLALTPADASDLRRRCAVDTFIYKTLVEAGCRCPEKPPGEGPVCRK